MISTCDIFKKGYHLKQGFDESLNFRIYSMRIKIVAAAALLIACAGAANASLILLYDPVLGFVPFEAELVSCPFPSNSINLILPADPGLLIPEPISLMPVFFQDFSSGIWESWAAFPDPQFNLESMPGNNQPVYVLYPDGTMLMYAPEPTSCLLMAAGSLCLFRRRAG